MITLLKQTSQNLDDSPSSNHDKNTTTDKSYLRNRHICPCCSYILLRHINGQGVYWYCSHCHQEMPDYNS